MEQSIYQLKPKFMSIERIKEVLHLRIEQGDERMLRVIHAVTEAYSASSETELNEEEIQTILPPPSKRLTMQELLSEIEEADAQIDQGEFLTSDELEKEMDKW